MFLLGSECKAITHWRVCLNHTEWLWILNAGLRPTEKQAHGGDSVSWVLIWFLIFFFFFGNRLWTGRKHCLCFSPSAAPPNQTTAGRNILSEWKWFDHDEHPVFHWKKQQLTNHSRPQLLVSHSNTGRLYHYSKCSIHFQNMHSDNPSNKSLLGVSKKESWTEFCCFFSTYVF